MTLSSIFPIFVLPALADNPKPVCSTNDTQSNPAAFSYQGSGAVFAWQDVRSGNSRVYVQRLCGACDTLTMDWTKNGVPVCTATGDQRHPVIVGDSIGNTIIVWEDNRNGTYAIYAQKVNASGAVQWAQDGVALCTAPFDKQNLAITGDSAGGAIITWEDIRTGTGIPNVYAQRISKEGIIRWQMNGVGVCIQAAGQFLPRVTCNAKGGAIVCWQDKRSGDFDIYAQRIDSTGSPLWTVKGMMICGALMFQLNPQMIGDGNGGAIIVWQDYRNTRYYTIFAQRVGPDGLVKWTAGGLAMNNSLSADQKNPVIVRDGSDGAIIAWEDKRGGNVDIYGQRVNLAGDVGWPSAGVPIVIAPGDQTGPQIVDMHSGGAIVTWVDHRTTPCTIYLQRITSDGLLKSGQGGMAVCSADSNQNNPVAVSDGIDGEIIAWQDFRKGSSAIYTQILPEASTGIQAGSPIVSIKFPKGKVRIDQSGAVHYVVEHAGPVSVEIVDLSGRSLAKRVFDHRNPGSYSMELQGNNGRDRISSGAYFCRMTDNDVASTYKFSVTK
jgi:predicted lipoprotein with Yx(FWY)xxD motif